MTQLLDRGQSQAVGSSPLAISLNWPGQDDVAADCFLLAAGDRVRDMGDHVHAGQQKAAGGAVLATAGDDFFKAIIDPVALPPEINRVLFVASRKGGFAGPVILFCGPAQGLATTRISQAPAGDANTVIMAALKRSGAIWQLEAIGQHMPDRSGLAMALGCAIDDSALPAAKTAPKPAPAASALAPFAPAAATPVTPPQAEPAPAAKPSKPVEAAAWVAKPGVELPPSTEQLPLPIGMALLAQPAMIDTSRLLNRLKQLYPQEFGQCDIKSGSLPAGFKGQSLIVMLPDRNLTIFNLPAPLPDGVLDVAVAKAGVAGWMDAASIAADHTGHVVISSQVKSRIGSIEDWPSHRLAYVRVSQLLGALANELKASAIYWGAAERLHKPEQYLALARPGALRLTPTDLWMDLTISYPAPLEVMVATQGLSALFGAEIITKPTPLDVERVAAAVYGVVALLFESGPILNEGQSLDNAYGDSISVKRENIGNRQIWRLGIEPRRR